MEIKLGEPPTTPSCSSCGGDSGCFECHICLDLAQDPIVTLCGHLFCWPCLYKWLQIHSQPQECPVCRTTIPEKSLVPLYGRGKNSSNPRSSIAIRPAGQRPPAALPHNPSYFGPRELGPGPMNFMFLAAFGGLIRRLFNLQVHGYPDTDINRPGSATGLPYGHGYSYHGGHALGVLQHRNLGQPGVFYWYMVILLAGLLIVFVLIWN